MAKPALKITAESLERVCVEFYSAVVHGVPYDGQFWALTPDGGETWNQEAMFARRSDNREKGPPPAARKRLANYMHQRVLEWSRKDQQTLHARTPRDNPPPTSCDEGPSPASDGQGRRC